MNKYFNKIKILLEEASDLEKAQNPSTHSDELHRLLNHKDLEISKAVASNPNINVNTWGVSLKKHPQEALDNPSASLFNLEDPNILRHEEIGNNYVKALQKTNRMPTNPEDYKKLVRATANYYTLSNLGVDDPDLLHELSTNYGDSATTYVIGHKNTRPETLEKIYNSSDQSDVPRMEKIAGHSNTPDYLLPILAQHPHHFVKNGVAENLKTPSNILSKLSEDPSRLVRGSVARSKNTDLNTLKKLSDNHQEDDVRGGVAGNPNASSDIINKLSQDKNPFIAASAMSHENFDFNSLPKNIYQLRADVQNGLMRNPNVTPDILEKLSKSQYPLVRMDAQDKLDKLNYTRKNQINSKLGDFLTSKFGKDIK